MVARLHGNNGSTRQEGKASEVAERRKEVFELYKAGKTQTEIAKMYGVTQPLIWRDLKIVMAELNATSLELAAEYRGIHLERLQTAFGAIWPKVVNMPDAKGVQPYTVAQQFEAVRTMIRLMEREAALLGLDAPTKVDILARVQDRAEQEGVDPGVLAAEVRIVEAEYKQLAAGK